MFIDRPTTGPTKGVLAVFCFLFSSNISAPDKTYILRVVVKDKNHTVHRNVWETIDDVITQSALHINVNKLNISRVRYHFLCARISTAGYHKALWYWLWRHELKENRASISRNRWLKIFSGAPSSLFMNLCYHIMNESLHVLSWWTVYVLTWAYNTHTSI